MRKVARRVVDMKLSHRSTRDTFAVQNPYSLGGGFGGGGVVSVGVVAHGAWSRGPVWYVARKRTATVVRWRSPSKSSLVSGMAGGRERVAERKRGEQ